MRVKLEKNGGLRCGSGPKRGVFTFTILNIYVSTPRGCGMENQNLTNDGPALRPCVYQVSNFQVFIISRTTRHMYKMCLMGMRVYKKLN